MKASKSRPWCLLFVRRKKAERIAVRRRHLDTLEQRLDAHSLARHVLPSPTPHRVPVMRTLYKGQGL